MVLVISPEDADDIEGLLRGMGERPHRIGVIEAKEEEEPPLLFAPPVPR